MGAIRQGQCPCGYHSDDIYTGFSGMTGREFNDFPCYCEDCNSLVILDLSAYEVVCSKCCSHNVFPYDHETICNLPTKIIHTVDLRPGVCRELNLSEDNNLCPNCKEYTLKFEFEGLWD